MRVSAMYEAALTALHEQLVAVIRTHKCHHAGCGDDDRCNPLGLVLCDVIDAAFMPEDATMWLAECPDAWEWGEPAFGYESVRDYVTATFRADAWNRLFPDYAIDPVDPAATIESSYAEKK